MHTTEIRRVQKMTSKGQITLPSKWRKEFGAEHVIVRAKGQTLTIAPARFDFDNDENRANDEVIFNAERDNKGKSIPASEFIRVLEKLVKEDEKARKTTAKAQAKR